MNPFKHDMHGHFSSGHSGPPDPKNIVSFEVALKEKKQIAEGTYAFSFEKPKGFQFRAGQHVRMTLINPPETDKEGDGRFFSMASTPEEEDLLFAMSMRDTAFKRILGKMQLGEKVTIQMRLDNPHGSFTLHEDAAKPAVFIIGGIGIVPAYSMIKDALQRKLSHKMVLFYSNRRPEDAPFLEELEKLAKQHSQLTLVTTMTDIKNSTKSWKGKAGKIDLPLIKEYVKDFKMPIYYISGLSEMVSAMKTMITTAGVSNDNIHAEEFTGFNLNEMHGRMGQHTSHNPNMNHLLLLGVGLIITAVVIGHLIVASSLFKSGFNAAIFSNPIFYIMLIGMVVIIPFKFKHIASVVHKIKNK